METEEDEIQRHVHGVGDGDRDGDRPSVPCRPGVHREEQAEERCENGVREPVQARAEEDEAGRAARIECLADGLDEVRDREERHQDGERAEHQVAPVGHTPSCPPSTRGAVPRQRRRRLADRRAFG